ncbi:MAG TPA: alpha/beta hydrolase [Abditibacteriaceae bacterium]
MNFIHRYEAGESANSPTLLLLHGTGGDENNLLPFGRELVKWNLLSPRGQVLENGAPRFFRRLREGVFDEDDVRQRANELADWIGAAAQEHGFDANNVWALGYSNGANIAAAMLMLRPEILRAAVLWRAMMPLSDAAPVALSGTRVLLSAGKRDPIVPPLRVKTLADWLETSGADVSLRWRESGHELHGEDIDDTRAFLNG